MSETVAGVISREEIDAAIRRVHEAVETACARYACGFITEESRFGFAAEALRQGTGVFLSLKGLRLRVSARDWPVFLAGIRAWEKDGDENRLQACSWLYFISNGKEAAVSDKVKVLNLLDACRVPIEYYRPVPEGIICPDEYPAITG